ncbi:hypothetical protein EON65_40135 [archaeon]|nr:MAG: hypothetical protein EON65_40135 [archaeon]
MPEIKVILFVAILSAIISPSIVLLCDFVMSKFIAAPVAKSSALFTRVDDNDEDNYGQQSQEDRSSNRQQSRYFTFVSCGVMILTCVQCMYPYSSNTCTKTPYAITNIAFSGSSFEASR